MHTVCWVITVTKIVFYSICMGWLRLAGSLKSYVSFAKETYKRDYILQQSPHFKEPTNRRHLISLCVIAADALEERGLIAQSLLGRV